MFKTLFLIGLFALSLFSMVGIYHVHAATPTATAEADAIYAVNHASVYTATPAKAGNQSTTCCTNCVEGCNCCGGGECSCEDCSCKDGKCGASCEKCDTATATSCCSGCVEDCNCCDGGECSCETCCCEGGECTKKCEKDASKSCCK